MSPEEFARLQAENQKLKAKLDKQQQSKQKRRKLGWTFLKQSSGFILGAKLKKSIERFLEELSEQQRVSRETLSDLLSAIIIRLTRVGFLLVITAILPSILLIFQTYYLSQQNKLITGQSEMFKQQNNRLDQQTYLQEAERRGQTLLLMDNMLKEISDDVRVNPQNTINDATAGRLISLSKMLKPYKYLENDSLIVQVISPERGYLLVSLLETGINLNATSRSRTNGKLMNRLDFTYAELRDLTLKGADLLEINLSYADLRNSNFTGTDFKKADLSNARLQQTNLSYTGLGEADLENAKLQNAILDRADLSKTNLTGADLRNTSLVKTKIKEAVLKNARVQKAFEQDASLQLNKDQSAWLFQTYEVVEIDEDHYQLLPKS
ncbi:pentapeptide repeat-containing protein [Leeuwenhoekiella parthenopeia]|uniref:Pentapeptide repeat-containing protein n=1 Tax=Leeuwenhoekiella parthenopeia TaxID=2890320 RepID=A0ABS8GMP5_9FLAO|nr:pentapeptide repeat-containing protein [Leeuwenhoekiella parthenopeia]MCC4211179.1 pentapeptide repeat-containing protein [Leeuwenhoekiella parthenopeia]